MSLPLADKWIWIHSGRRAHRTDAIVSLEIRRSERRDTKDLWYVQWSGLTLTNGDRILAGYQGDFINDNNDIVYVASYKDAIAFVEQYHVAVLNRDLRRFNA